ncbi:MAG: LysM peptidoglycan-binding domain-containing protein [Thermodesulfobacteriota bacterium]
MARLFSLSDAIFDNIRDHVTQDAVDYINDSPTLRTQLEAFAAGRDGRDVPLQLVSSRSGAQYNPNTHTIILGGDFFAPSSTLGWQERNNLEFVGALAHELGHHFEPFDPLTRSLPNGFEYFIRLGGAEAYAIGNNYVVYREIMDRSGVAISTHIAPDRLAALDTRYAPIFDGGHITADDLRLDVYRREFDTTLTATPSTNPGSTYFTEGVVFYLNIAATGISFLGSPFNARLMTVRADQSSFGSNSNGMPTRVQMVFDNTTAWLGDNSLPQYITCDLERLNDQVIQAIFTCDDGTVLTGLEFSNSSSRGPLNILNGPAFSMQWSSLPGGEGLPVFTEVTGRDGDRFVLSNMENATLGDIAEAQGVSLAAIRAANPGLDAMSLVPGTVVNLPDVLPFSTDTTPFEATHPLFSTLRAEVLRVGGGVTSIPRLSCSTSRRWPWPSCIPTRKQPGSGSPVRMTCAQPGRWPTIP